MEQPANPKRHHKDQYGQSRFDTVPPQLMTNLSTQDYVDVLKEARWNNDYRNIIMMKYLGVGSIEDMVHASHRCGIAASLVIRYVLPEFFASKGLKVDKIVNIESDGDYAASFSAIEIAPNKFENRLDYGDYCVSNAEAKYVIHLESAYPDSFVFRISASKTANPDVFCQEMVKYAEGRNFLKGQKIDPNCNFIKLNRKFTWDDLILSAKLKEQIKMNLQNLIAYHEIYKKNGLQVKRGLILAGEPGTGKTVLAKILCNQIDWTFVWVTSKNLEDAKRVAQIVELARDLSPSVLFLEDIDLFGGSRESSRNPMILGELMNQLDGVEENTDIIVIGSTNNKEVLEKALVSRPGRFDKVIDFPLPAYAERLQMLKIFSNGLLNDTPCLEKIAREYKKKTGAQIRELVNMAVIFAVDEKSYGEDQKLIVKEEHFNKAIKAVEGKDFTQPMGFDVGASSPIGGNYRDYDD
ncbi:MAG: AAA family ATPase [bacterium]